MNWNDCSDEERDYGGCPFVTDISRRAARNTNFRTAIWTGSYLQMTLMHLPPHGEIGEEMHGDTDQLLRVEQGCGMVKMGARRGQMDTQYRVCRGDAIFVPAGTWHNVINIGRMPLKISSVYAPPNHQKGTVHRTKKDAELAEY